MRLWLLLLVALSANGATLYVSPTGNDSTGDGSIGTPWLTVAHATAAMSGGDTLYLRGGTYVETNWVNQKNNWKSGTPATPTQIRSYPGEVARLSQSQASATFVLEVGNTATNILFADMVLDNTNANLATAGTSVIKFTDASQYLTLSNCVLANAPRGMGASIGTSTLVPPNTFYKIVACTFTNTAWDHQGGDSPPHHMYVQTAGNTVEYCTFGPGAQDFCIQNYNESATNNIYRLNVFNFGTNGSRGLGLEWGNSCYVYNNLFYSNTGFQVTCDNLVYSNVVANNTFVGNKAGIALVTCHDNIIENNTIYGDYWSYAIQVFNTSTNDTVRNNLICHNIDYNGTTNFVNSFAGIGTVLSNNLLGDSFDPRFVNIGVLNFHTQANGDGVNTGFTEPLFNTDYDGNRRPSGAAWDIGAYEYQFPQATAATLHAGTLRSPP